MDMLAQNKKTRKDKVPMSAPIAKPAEPIGALEPSKISCRNTAAHALTIVRDGVITGEGPTTKGRIHFSRTLDADAAAWCARILTASAVAHHAASESGLPVPPRTVALSPDTDIASWAPAHARNIDIQMLEWIAGQMRGKRSNHTLVAMVATVVGAAALPLA